MLVEVNVKVSGRCDRILRNEGISEWLSRSSWDWLFQEGRIRSERRLSPGDEVGPGTVIKVDFPGPVRGLLPASTGVRVLAEGEGWWFVEKPAGVHSVGQFPWEFESLASRVSRELATRNVMDPAEFCRLADPPLLEGGLLQRLDFSTSGGVLVALNRPIRASFRELIQAREMEKTYLALVTGEFHPPRGEVIFHLADGAGGKKKVVQTNYTETVALSFEVLVSTAKATLVRIKTRDGARHVVRVTSAAMGHPLVGDQTYGGATGVSPDYPHHLLHAESVSWKDGGRLWCPMPSPFLRSLEDWEIDGGSISQS